MRYLEKMLTKAEHDFIDGKSKSYFDEFEKLIKKGFVVGFVCGVIVGILAYIIFVV